MARKDTNTRHRTMTVRELVSLVDQRVWRMPEFQRKLKWDAKGAARMLDSLARDISMRQVLVWCLTGSDRCFVRTYGEVETTVVTAGAELLVDGQQRLTVLTLLAGRDIPEWCPSDDKAVKAIRAKTAYNVVTGEFASRTVLKRAGTHWVRCHDLLTSPEDQLGELIRHALGAGVREDDLVSAQSRAENLRDTINQRKLAVEVCEMDLATAIEAFERWNAAGVDLSQEDILKAVISGYCQGLPSERIDPFVQEMEGKLGSADVAKAAIRTLMTYMNHTRGNPANSRLPELDFSGSSAEEWVEAWDKVEVAWKRVAVYLTDHHVHPSIIAASNPLVPLVLFALAFPDMFGDDRMLALYLLGVRTRRFDKHSTDAHMLDAQTILGARSGMHALVAMVDKISAQHMGDYGTDSVGLTTRDLLRSKTTKDNMELFLSVALARRGSVDWKTGQRLVLARGEGRTVSPTHDVELHHVYPKALARKHGADIVEKDGQNHPGRHQMLNSIAAMAMLEAGTNNAYGDNAPSVALKDVPVERLEQQFWADGPGISTLEQAVAAVEARAKRLTEDPEGVNWFVTLLTGLEVPADEAAASPAPAPTEEVVREERDAPDAEAPADAPVDLEAALVALLRDQGYDPAQPPEVFGKMMADVILTTLAQQQQQANTP